MSSRGLETLCNNPLTQWKSGSVTGVEAHMLTRLARSLVVYYFTTGDRDWGNGDAVGGCGDCPASYITLSSSPWLHRLNLSHLNSSKPAFAGSGPALPFLPSVEDVISAI